MTENRKIVEFAGVKFYHEQVTPTYVKLTPVNDPVWLLRHCETVALRKDTK